MRNHVIRARKPLPGGARKVTFTTNDGSGDCLTGVLERPLSETAAGPVVLLVHGLTGCEDSTYMRRSARFHLARGRLVLRLNLRGAGPSRPFAKGYYHAGGFGDLRDVLDGLERLEPGRDVFAVGFSLGGNILLNLLGWLTLPHRLVGAATVSAPVLPGEACRSIMRPRNALYHRYLLTRMKRDVLASVSLTDDERRAVAQARSVYEFDDQWVAPHNGFRNADDYYSRTAGLQHVPMLKFPTLMLHARNDPWIPAQPYLALSGRTPANVRVVVAQGGGHVGFHERGHTETWHDRMIDAFIGICASEWSAFDN